MSRALVFLQFALIALIAYPSHMPAAGWLSSAIVVAGLVVFTSACWAMKRPTFTVMPEPKAGGHLITTGIYSFIRHPMYLAVLLCAVGVSMAYGLAWKWILSAVLTVVLWIKLRREERMLFYRYPGYSLYRQHTKALFPFLL